jgi:transcription elongation factor SPT4
MLQFEEEGCDNCEQGIGMGVDAIQDQCTPNFSGMIAIMVPDKSWCARWTRKRKYIPGIYALKLEDEEGV